MTLGNKIPIKRRSTTRVRNAICSSVLMWYKCATQPQLIVGMQPDPIKKMLHSFYQNEALYNKLCKILFQIFPVIYPVTNTPDNSRKNNG